MHKSLFNEQMSSSEALTAFIKAVKSNPNDKDNLFQQYKQISDKIYAREAKLAAKGWIID